MRMARSRYDGSRYFSQVSAGSRTWPSASTTGALSGVVIAVSSSGGGYCSRANPFPLERRRNPFRHLAHAPGVLPSLVTGRSPKRAILRMWRRGTPCASGPPDLHRGTRGGRMKQVALLLLGTLTLLASLIAGPPAAGAASPDRLY